MTAQMFIATAFYGAVSIIFTAIFASITAIAVFYSYKVAENLIKDRSRYIKKIKKSKAFRAFNEKEKIEFKVVPKKNGKAAAK